jgi:hypothetical protein
VSTVKEKRTSPRIQPYIVPCVIVKGKKRVPGYLTDLSSQGGRFTCEGTAPAAGTAVSLEFRIGRQVESSRLRVAVKWIRRGPGETRSVGFRFERIKATERAAIEEVVDDFRGRAAEILRG